MHARVCLGRGRWLCEHGHSGGHGDSGRKCPHDVSLVHDAGGRGWNAALGPVQVFPWWVRCCFQTKNSREERLRDRKLAAVPGCLNENL